MTATKIPQGALPAKSGDIFTIMNDAKEVIRVDKDGVLTMNGYATGTLFEMALAGDDIVKNKEKYLNEILNLPNVQGNQLKAIKVFNRLRKLVELLEK